MARKNGSTAKSNNDMINQDDNNEVLKPSVVETIQTQPAPAEIVLPRGHVLIAELDANGNEIPGSEFHIHEKGYEHYYTDETKFKLKKKAQ